MYIYMCIYIHIYIYTYVCIYMSHLDGLLCSNRLIEANEPEAHLSVYTYVYT